MPARSAIASSRLSESSLEISELPEEELARLHHEIAAQITQDGQQWISTTRVRGRSVLRMMVISYLTQERHIDALATRLQKAAKSVLDRSLGATRVS